MSDEPEGIDLFIADLAEIGYLARSNTVRPGVPGKEFGTFRRTPEYERAFCQAVERVRKLSEEDHGLADCLVTGAFLLLTEGKDLTVMSMAADLAATED